MNSILKVPFVSAVFGILSHRRTRKVQPDGDQFGGTPQQVAAQLALERSLGHGEDDTGDLVHAIACPDSRTLYLGSASMWDVQRITIQ